MHDLDTTLEVLSCLQGEMHQDGERTVRYAMQLVIKRILNERYSLLATEAACQLEAFAAPKVAHELETVATTEETLAGQFASGCPMDERGSGVLARRRSAASVDRTAGTTKWTTV